MTAKRLIPLLVLLTLLLGVALLLKRQEPPTRLADEAGFVRLIPAGVQAATITGLDLYHGSKPESVVRLRRQDDAWVATSHFNGPVKQDKINAFLARIETLSGELRSADPELLADYRLEDQQALHLKVYADSSASPAVHLLAGPASGRSGFVRSADNARVYSVDLQLSREAGLFGNDADQAPEAKPWLDLRIQNIPEADVVGLELQSPARHLGFKRQPASEEPSQAAGNTPASAEATWLLEAPASTPFTVKQSALNSTVTALRTPVAAELVDASDLGAYGLADPPFRASLLVQPAEQAPSRTTLLIGDAVPEEEGNRYARRANGNRVYVIPKWTFERIFQPVGALLQLDVLRLPPQDVVRLEIRHNDTAWTVERPPAEKAAGDETASTWRLVGDGSRPIDAEAIDTVLNTLSQLVAEDWLEETQEPTGLDQPAVDLTLVRRDGRSEHLTLGNARQGEPGGYYLEHHAVRGVFVVSDTVHTSLTQALETLRPPAATPPSSPVPSRAPDVSESVDPQSPEATPAPDHPAAAEPPPTPESSPAPVPEAAQPGTEPGGEAAEPRQ